MKKNWFPLLNTSANVAIGHGYFPFFVFFF